MLYMILTRHLLQGLVGAVLHPSQRLRTRHLQTQTGANNTSRSQCHQANAAGGYVNLKNLRNLLVSHVSIAITACSSISQQLHQFHQLLTPSTCDARLALLQGTPRCDCLPMDAKAETMEIIGKHVSWFSWGSLSKESIQMQLNVNIFASIYFMWALIYTWNTVKSKCLIPFSETPKNRWSLILLEGLFGRPSFSSFCLWVAGGRSFTLWLGNKKQFTAPMRILVSLSHWKKTRYCYCFIKSGHFFEIQYGCLTTYLDHQFRSVFLWLWTWHLVTIPMTNLFKIVLSDFIEDKIGGNIYIILSELVSCFHLLFNPLKFWLW